LMTHFGVSDVVDTGLLLLANLAVNPANQAALMDQVGLVRPALIRHSGVSDVVDSGLVFLANLASNAGNKVALMKEVDLVRPALRDHRGVVGVACSGLRLLVSLAADASNKVPLSAYVDLLHPTLAANRDEVSVISFGVSFVGCLAADIADTERLTMGVSLVRFALETHVGVIDVVQPALLFMCSLAARPANSLRETLMLNVDVVSSVMEVHRHVPAIMETVLRLLAALAELGVDQEPLLRFVDLVPAVLVDLGGCEAVVDAAVDFVFNICGSASSVCALRSRPTLTNSTLTNSMRAVKARDPHKLESTLLIIGGTAGADP
jgi:hypothetical protein